MTHPTSIQNAAEETGLVGALVRRWAGAWIDFIFLVIVVAGPALVLGEELFASTMFGWAALGLLYFPVLEGFWGRSLGKLVTGLRVVDKNGRPPGVGRALIRTVTRLVEVNPILAGGVPAGLFVFFTKRKQRLGDLIAGTYVLSADKIKVLTDVDETLAELRAKA
ncbi:MAG: RDD family protein [Caulobacterales bacterium]